MQQLFLFTMLSAILFACGSNDTSNQSSIDMNGPDLELNVISFSPENNETELEFINRLDEGITNLNGVLTFYDDAGEVITFANGTPRTSSFSRAQNPQIVKAKNKTTFKLMNSVPDGAVSVDAIELRATTKSGDEIAF